MRTLTIDQARRIALAAQGFAAPRPEGRVDVRHLRRVLRHVRLLQIDSVNVLVRSHYLPLFSRLGPYPLDLLDGAAYDRRELFEYWGHEASLIPVADQPLLRHRQRAWPAGPRTQALLDVGYMDEVLEQVAARGPLTTSDLADPGSRRGPWWGWNRGKIALEWLFARGELAVATRVNFTRYYDLTEKVLPADLLDAPTPDPDEALRALLLAAARALGVATVADLADYYRLNVPRARATVADLVAAGRLQRVEVDAWPQPAYMHPAATLPRKIRAGALLSPFDSLVWNRDRVERLFGFRYRIEIYTPAAKRTYGYYVLPFLLDDGLAARVDLKADRAHGRLLVQAAWIEDGWAPARVAAALREELTAVARWLELDDIVVADRGTLVTSLRREVGAA